MRVHRSTVRATPRPHPPRQWYDVLSMGTGTTLDRDRALALVEPLWRRFYNFVFRLTLDRERAERYLADIFTVAATQLHAMPADEREREVWLLGFANKVLEERLPRQPEVNFDILDDTLR